MRPFGLHRPYNQVYCEINLWKRNRGVAAR
jgi:hypothetical protein